MSRAFSRLKEVFHDLPIRYKLLLVYSTIFAVAIALGSLVIYASVRHTIEADVEVQLKTSTDTLVSMVSASASLSLRNHLQVVVERNREIVVHLYGKYLNGELTEEEAMHRAADMLLSQTVGKTGYIYCVNGSGVIKVHPDTALLGKDISRFAFIQEQIKRKEGYLEYYWRNPGEEFERAKALCMTYFAPWDWIISASSYREEFTSLINMDDFRDSVLSIRFGQTGYCFVMDSKGNVIVHPKLTESSHEFIDSGRRMFMNEIGDRKSGKITYFWKNPDETSLRKKLAIFGYLPEFDWIVVSSSYMDEFDAPLKTIKDTTILTVILTLLPVIWLTMWMSGSITRPLQTLMERFSAGIDGNLGVRVETRARDEIGRLAGYFNDFMEKLEASQNSLRAEIGERKHAEQLLQIRTREVEESEEKYRALFDCSKDPVLIIDNARFVDCNEATVEALRFQSKEKLLQTHPSELSPPVQPDGRSSLEKAEEMMDLARQKGYHHFEWMHLKSQGEVLPVDVSLTIIPFKGRQIIHMVWRDITDRKKAEEAVRRYQDHLEELVEERTAKLAESERRFRAIFESSNDAIMLLTEKGFLDCNSRTLEMFGFRSKDDFIEAHPSDISPPFQPDGRDSRSSAREHIEGAFRSEPQRFEWVHRRTDGSDFPADVLLSALDLNGQRALQATVRDITERKRAEEALRKSERQLADIIAFLPDPAMVIDAEGRITAWNLAMEEMTGARAEEMLGKGNYEYAIPFYGERRPVLIDLVKEPIEEVLSKYAHLGRRGNTLTGQGLITHLGTGDLHFVGNASALRDADGNIVGAIETVRDITDRIRAEEALKESYARLEEANNRIMESIGYARIIQGAILPNRDEIMRYAKDSFLIWRPKDMIGGDMFWVDARRKEEFMLAVIDCTGHGVPGAIMTMIAATTLDRVVHEVGYGDPAMILGKLNAHVQRSLHQQSRDAESNDGLDIGLCHVNCARGILTYAGARISLLYGASGQIQEIKGDRQSIGYKTSDVNYTYASHSVHIDSGMAFYMNTDGLTDQVGGGKSFPFGKKRLRDFLVEHHRKPLYQQEELLLETFERYRGDELQRDDMMVVGFRLE